MIKFTRSGSPPNAGNWETFNIWKEDADAAEAALSAAPSARPSVPPGWKLVPVEPTDEMVMAACTAWLDRPNRQRKSTGEYAREDWAAMLSVAPEPMP